MTEYRRLCAKCHEPIQAGEKTASFMAAGQSGPGITVELHDRCPGRMPPYQRAPAVRGD